MPYGAKRGFKSPGEFGVADYAGLALAGATGIVAALVTDYRSKGEASAIYTINQWVVSAARLFGLEAIPLYVVVVGLIGIGAASIFYFQPITRQGAFAQGFGLLAVLMTSVPSDLAGGLEAIGVGLTESEFGVSDLSRGAALDQEVGFEGGIVPASFSPGEARVYAAQARRVAAYDVTIQITFEGGMPPDIQSMLGSGALRGRLHNSDTRQTFNLFKSAGGVIGRDGDSILIRTGIPARSQAATLWARVEAEGYTIEQQSAQATVGQPLVWRINMQKSSTPLFVQRLGKSYWF